MTKGHWTVMMVTSFELAPPNSLNRSQTCLRCERSERTDAPEPSGSIEGRRRRRRSPVQEEQQQQQSPDFALPDTDGCPDRNLVFSTRLGSTRLDSTRPDKTGLHPTLISPHSCPIGDRIKYDESAVPPLFDSGYRLASPRLASGPG